MTAIKRCGNERVQGLLCPALAPSPSTTWDLIMFETMADYMDEMERRIAMFDDPTRLED